MRKILVFSFGAKSDGSTSQRPVNFGFLGEVSVRTCVDRVNGSITGVPEGPLMEARLSSGILLLLFLLLIAESSDLPRLRTDLSID